MKFGRSWLREILIWGLVALAVYFGNVQLQTWLGHRARAATGLVDHSFEEGLELARQENKLVVADLGAVWCSRCRTLDEKVLADPRVKERLQRDFVFVRVEYESDEGKAFAERYHVRGFPVLLLLDAQGQLIRPLPIRPDPVSFLAALPPS